MYHPSNLQIKAMQKQSNTRREEGKSIGNIPTNTKMGEKILPFPRRSTMWMIIFIIIHQFTAFCGSIAKGGSRTGQSFCYNIFKQEEDTTLNYGPSCLYYSVTTCKIHGGLFGIVCKIAGSMKIPKG